MLGYTYLRMNGSNRSYMYFFVVQTHTHTIKCEGIENAMKAKQVKSAQQYGV